MPHFMPNSESSAKPVRRGLVYTLSLLLIWQPMLLSAQPITPTHGTNGRPTMDKAANGVPVVNIQNPNSKGVSQNFYNDFNVGSKGVVLNNSQQVTQTQLGGYIEGNPNLHNGSASLILNEVIGQNPSNLGGYIEVGGARADVVVANPNGISCNGCGFINTNHATLTTGKSIMEGGELQGFDVQGGRIGIGENGLNGSNTDRFDLIARSVKVAGELHADSLNIVTGQQRVDRNTLATSNETTGTNKPGFAIDSSALGGMYANRIRLIANEEGVGVKLDAPVAAQNGDMVLSANGKIQNFDLAATGNIAIDANQNDIMSTGTVLAKADLSVNAADYTNSGYVVADGMADIQATTVTNTGTLGGREALTVKADSILNDQGGALLSENDITLSADQVTNRLADIYTSGTITISGNDGESAEKLENRSGRIEAEGDVAVQAEQILNVRDVLDWEDVLVDAKAQYFCIECEHTNFTMRYTFTEEFVRELDEATTGRSLLVAGGDMSLTGEELVNETSDILAYGNMNLDVDRIDNIGLHSGEYVLINHYKKYLSDDAHVANVRYGIEPYNNRNYFGRAEYWGDGGNKALEYMRLHPGWNNSSYDPDNFLKREDNWVVKNTPHIGEETVPLESAEILGANIISGGDLDMGGAAVTNGDFGHKQAGGVSEEELIAVGEGAGRGGNDMDSYLDGANGGLFSIADPDHPYLIETNPFFASRDGFLGSEYLLNRLGWDPNGAMRLLGDGFYEQQLIRQQVVDLTGRALLDQEYVDANAQYRALLDNGLFAAESLELTVGVALNPEQVNKLTRDVVWMVEQEVAGETVLVPQLYLSPQSAVIDENGALIASGGDMVNDGGSIVNSGTIHIGGDTHFNLNEEGLQNLGGDIIGEGLVDIESEGDVRNVSGTIRGREVALKSAEEIINQRLVYQSEISDGTGWREWHTQMGKAATIDGLESVALDAGDDIRITGSRIQGGSVAINAEGDIVVDTVTDQSGRKGSYHSGKLSESRIRHIGSEITATMNLLASASNDFNIIGSDLASDGGVQLSAGNDLLIASAANSDSYDFRVRHDGETSHNIQRSVRQQGSSVTAGGDVVMESGNDLTAIASRLEAGEDLSLMGKGDISILAAQNSDYRYSYEEDDSSFGRSKTTTIEHETKNAIGSLLTAGGTLSLAAEAGDVKLIASNGHGEEGVEVEAGRDVHIESGVNSAYTRIQTTDKNAARIKTRDTGSMAQTLAQAGLTSGAELSLDAKGDVVLGAAQLEAQGDLRIGDAALVTAENGALRLDDEGNPIIERGSIDNLYIGTVALENENWDIKTRSLRGPVKELAKASSVIMGAGGMYLPGLALGAKDMEVTLSESTESRVHERREVGSALQAENIQLSAQNDMTLTGSSLEADEESGKVVMLADNILLDTAVTETTITEKDETETASSIDPSLKKDEISLGGLRLTELEQATVTNTLTHSGSSISGNQIVLEADSELSLINADIEATGEDGVLSLAGDSVSITGVQDEKTVTETLKEKTTETSVGIRNAYVDAAYAVEGLKKAGEAVGDAVDGLKEAERRVERGELAKDALDDYRIMVAAAEANLVQAQLALGMAMAAGTAAAGTGFYVSGSAQHSETTSTSTETQKDWKGSTLNASAMSINADKASIIGSDINAGVLDLNAADILIGAGTNEQSSRFEQESKNGGFSVSTSGAGSWNANVGFNEADSQSQATQYVNSQLNVGHLASNSESLTVKGGLITANSAEIETGALHIESLQDTYSSSNSSMGANLGIAGAGNERKPASGSAGFNMAEGSSEGARTNQQSAILVADGENSRVTARDTTLIGGMIANASYEENAETGELALVDHGNLSFATETLTVEDLRDYSKSEQQGVGLQVSNVGKQEYEGTREDLKGKEQTTGTTTVSLQNSGSRMEGQTLATIGAGNITVGGVSLDEHADYADLNRDINESQVVTLDQQTGVLDVGVTVDNRLFSEVGRAEIVEQQLSSGTNAQTVISGVGGEISRGVDLGVRISGVDNPTVMREIINQRIGAFGILPTAQNFGGLLAQLPGQLLPGSDAHQQQMVIATADNPYMLANPELGWVPISETPGYHLMNAAQQAKLAGTMVSTNPLAIAAGTATYQNSTNGMLNTPALASYNAVTQTHDLLNNPEQPVLVTLNYNPSRGVLADLFESAQDTLSIKLGQSWMATNVAVDTGIFANQVMLARGDDHANLANHSQGNLLNYSGLLAVGLSEDIAFGTAGNPNFTWNMFGSPVNLKDFNTYLHSNSMLLTSSSVNSGDFVGQGLGGNHGLYVYGSHGQSVSVVDHFDATTNSLVTMEVPAVPFHSATQNQPGWGNPLELFSGSSPHSNYSCVTRCGAKAP
ncbi:filamentous hemagglutinin N-terminal domain-containing protein [Alcanivorax sp. VBW004]|uniref:two-partner secretion domain-containing protein n=1 Tax=Alcanivorax sp. VBW004 TaxID=1287708 RepID=UPI0012BB58FA|nr:hemagglutinin repeat-containing protein [Alcanivorax sp. VBW004]MTT52521.1 filamentous hemagglutinin N-terminal domain-containing protein [Alcanivorax sp. VBW004]